MISAEDVFSPFGLLKNKKKNYSYRSGQEEMAKRVEEAFLEKKGAIIEAGTGIGKSFAYLVPSFLLVSEKADARVVIATSTITLQKQLFDLDIPFLTKALGVENKSAVLYGRNNYICKSKIDNLINASTLLSLDSTCIESRFISWCKKTETGSRIDISDKELMKFSLSFISDENTCASKHCPHYQDCFMYSARRKAQNAKVIVTNHHLVLVDSVLRWENETDFSEPLLLPGYTHLVLDEAHHIEKEATVLYSDTFSYNTLSSQLDYMVYKNSEIGNKSLIEYLSQCDTSKNRAFTSNIESTIRRIKTLTRTFLLHLASFIASYSSVSPLLLERDFFDKYRTELREGELISNEIKTLSNDITSYIKSDDEALLPSIERLHRNALMLFNLGEVLLSFIRFSDYDSTIPYVEKEDDGLYKIVLSPLLVGPMIKARLLDKLESYLFSSATLSVGSNFDYFKSRLALENEDLIEGIYYSPFDYSHNLMYLVPQDARPYVNGDALYIDYLVSVIADAICSSSGGALVLFTSIDMMTKVHKRVNEKIGKELKILLQDNTRSRSSLLKEFKDDKDSSLFAVSSFWEGIDAPGETLRLLIITKLPFDVPTDPVNKARSDYINRSGDKSSFLTLTLPNAMIKMKQGIGRLIRAENDRGVVLILDGRITKKFYSHLLFSSIPPGYFPLDTMIDNIGKRIESFLF